jgi:hypothetical protein
MKISFFPYDTSLTSTRLLFRTVHRQQPAAFPSIPTTDLTLNQIRHIVDLLVSNPDFSPFLRPLSSTSADFNSYHSIVKNPIDFSRIREKVYRAFDDFTADIKLMIDNANLYYPEGSRVRQSAAVLRDVFQSELQKIGTNSQRAGLPPQARLGRKDPVRSPGDLKRLPPSESARVSDSDLNRLQADLERLPSNGLVGVAEIVTNRTFDEGMLPVKINLSQLSLETIQQLRKYVESVNKVESSKKGEQPGYYFAWRPILPQELQNLRDEYKSRLEGWRGKVEVNERLHPEEKWGMDFSEG